MEISEALKTIIINTLKQSWYIWLIIILIPILFGVAGIIVSRIKRSLNYKIDSFINERKIVDNDKKGSIGERKVSNILSRLDSRKYRIINDITVSINKEKAQIDHLVISNFGIFVIETKNYEGIVYGN